MSTVGRYRLTGEIGRGEMTVVHKAVNPLNRTVAVKLFAQNMDADTPEGREWRDQFQREVEAAGRLDHDNIVHVLDAGVDGGRHYVVMEYVEGETLAAALRRGPLGDSRKIEIGIALCEALAVAHTAGVVHQHLRPSNVLLAVGGGVKVADFALARLGIPATESTPMPGAFRVHYRSPEQIYGKKADERSDVFSLGVVLYEMFLGRKPFDGQTWMQITQRILNDPPPHLTESGEDAASPLVRILARALAKNPLDRYQSAIELRQELGKLLARAGDGSGELSPSGARRDAALETGGAGGDDAGPHLIVEVDRHKRVLPLREAEFTIGRRAENSLTLRDEHISRAHAKIVRTPDGFELIDLESKHGTFLNGQQVRTAPLVDGDRIEIGKNARFRITFRANAHDLTTQSSDTLEPRPQDRDMELLLDIARALNSSLSKEDVLNLIMDSALTFTGAERGYVLLRGADDKLTTRFHRILNNAQRPTLGESAVSMSVVERCVLTQQPVVIHNVDEFSDFAQKESILDLSLKSILCVPLICKGTVLGVLYLDSQQLKAPFKSMQLNLLSAFAAHAAIALENAALYEDATVDRLTGTYLRHHFDRRLGEEFQRAVRHDSPLSLLFMDIDHFKKINDTYGHPAGDGVLRVVGHTLRSLGRNTDLVARYGGEEFVLLAPETRREYAEALAERIRVAVAETPVSDGDHTVRLTLSVGVAAYPETGIATPEDLVRAADEALLLAKSSGRDRVCVAQPSRRPSA